MAYNRSLSKTGSSPPRSASNIPSGQSPTSYPTVTYNNNQQIRRAAYEAPPTGSPGYMQYQRAQDAPIEPAGNYSPSQVPTQYPPGAQTVTGLNSRDRNVSLPQMSTSYTTRSPSAGQRSIAPNAQYAAHHERRSEDYNETWNSYSIAGPSGISNVTNPEVRNWWNPEYRADQMKPRQGGNLGLEDLGPGSAGYLRRNITYAAAPGRVITDSEPASLVPEVPDGSQAALQTATGAPSLLRVPFDGVEDPTITGLGGAQVTAFTKRFDSWTARVKRGCEAAVKLGLWMKRNTVEVIRIAGCSALIVGGAGGIVVAVLNHNNWAIAASCVVFGGILPTSCCSIMDSIEKIRNGPMGLERVNANEYIVHLPPVTDGDSRALRLLLP